MAVGHSERNDSLRNLDATGLLSTVAQAKAEVGVVAETGWIRLAVGRGATQVSLLGEHVLDAGSTALGNGVDVLATDGANKGKGEDSHRLHLDC